jgi:hypothetical protein
VGIEAEDGIAEAEVAEVIEEESPVDYPCKDSEMRLSIFDLGQS